MKQKKKLEILLVDDSKDFLKMEKDRLGFMLKDKEHNIDTAEDGSVALEKVKEHGWYDLILTDYRMPEMNGVEFYQKLDDKEQQTKVLICTADRVDVGFMRSITDLFIGTDYEIPRIIDKFEFNKNFEKIIQPYLD